MEVFGLSLKIGSISMTELTQAMKAYYLTVEGFLTSDLLLLNLRCMAGHIMREHDIYNIEEILEWKNTEMCADTLMNGHWEKLIGKVEGLLYATDNPDNYYMYSCY